MRRQDYIDLARDLNTVLRHSSPDTVQDRVDTLWLACNTITLTLKSKHEGFDVERFYADVFEGFEQYRKHLRTPDYGRLRSTPPRRRVAPEQNDDGMDASDREAMSRLARRAFRVEDPRES